MIHYSCHRWRHGDKLGVSVDTAAAAAPCGLTTLRIQAGKPAFLQEHLQRLCTDSQVLGLSLPDVQWVARILAKGILKNRLAVGVSRIVWLGSDSSLRNDRSGLYITFEGLRTLPRAATLLLLNHKPRQCRTVKSLAVQDSQSLWHIRKEHHCFDVLLQDEGDLLEATTGNLFLFRSGRLSTPHADGRILAGITRAKVLDAPTLAATECLHKRSWLNRAEACFITNCARGIVPVARIVSESGRIVWEGDPRHKIILKARRYWRRVMIESTKRSELQPEAAKVLRELSA